VFTSINVLPRGPMPYVALDPPIWAVVAPLALRRRRSVMGLLFGLTRGKSTMNFDLYCVNPELICFARVPIASVLVRAGIR